MKLFNNVPYNSYAQNIKTFPSSKILFKNNQDQECNCWKEIQKLNKRIEILTDLIICCSKEIEDIKKTKEDVLILNNEDIKSQIDNKQNDIPSEEDTCSSSDSLISTRNSYVSYLPYLSFFPLSVAFLYFIKKR
jgi:neutral trehalase